MISKVLLIVLDIPGHCRPIPYLYLWLRTLPYIPTTDHLEYGASGQCPFHNIQHVLLCPEFVDVDLTSITPNKVYR